MAVRDNLNLRSPAGNYSDGRLNSINLNSYERGDSYLQELEGNSLASPVANLSKPSAEDIFNIRTAETDNMKAAIAAKEAKVKSLENQRDMALITGALKSVTDVMNAQAQLSSIEGAAETNMYRLNYQRSLLMSAGKQAALDRQMEGEVNADQAQLALAAQGQNLDRAGAQKVASSYRAIAINNAMLEEAKMYAEMAGIDTEMANLRFEVDTARSQADMARTQGILNTGLSLAGYGMGL